MSYYWCIIYTLHMSLSILIYSINIHKSLPHARPLLNAQPMSGIAKYPNHTHFSQKIQTVNKRVKYTIYWTVKSCHEVKTKQEREIGSVRSGAGKEWYLKWVVKERPKGGDREEQMRQKTSKYKILSHSIPSSPFPLTQSIKTSVG